MRRWVGLTYLMCRLLDTVEDAKWLAKDKQSASFHDFDNIVSSPDELKRVTHWQSGFPQELNEGEKLLIKESYQIFDDFHHCPVEVRTNIRDLVASMSAGMRHYANQKVSGVLRLSGLQEVNQYCFFVAGIVGETLSKLLASHEGGLKLSSALIVDSHHFGLFLQKVNLLKDQYEDERDGRFLIPSRDEIYNSLKENAEGAMRYIEALPLSQKSYRLFCLWSLFLGLRTLPILRQQTSLSSSNKVSRSETEDLIQQMESAVGEPMLLRQAFECLMSGAHFPQTTEKLISSAPESRAWVMQFYRGSLSPVDMISLGL